MLSNNAMRELISNLKGRISKVLSRSQELPDREIFYLGEIYNTLDSIILYNCKMSPEKVDYFKKNLKDYSNIVKNSQKPYIGKHIIPIIKKVVEQEWV